MRWLTEAIESVLAQAYENWELLLIDDGSSAAGLVDALPALAARDRRIILDRTGKTRRHFCGFESSGSLALAANGSLFSIMTTCSNRTALFQIAKLLQTHPDADLIYSDEDKLTDDGCESPVFKPDWSPDLFRSYNYVGHLTAIRRDVGSESRRLPVRNSTAHKITISFFVSSSRPIGFTTFRGCVCPLAAKRKFQRDQR